MNFLETAGNLSNEQSESPSRKESINQGNGNKKSNTGQGNTNSGHPEKEKVYQNYNEQPVYAAKYTDSDNSEDEGMEDYKVGGYHPVHVG